MNGEIIIAIAVVVVGGVVVYVLLRKKNETTTALPVANPVQNMVPTAPPQNYLPIQSVPQSQPDWLRTAGTVVSALPAVVNTVGQIASLFN